MIELKHADCFDYVPELEDESIDFACLDPPYAISRNTGFEHTKKNGNKGNDKFAGLSFNFGIWDKNEIDLYKLLETLYPKMKKSSTLLIFYDLWKITTLRDALKCKKFGKLRFAEWVKTNPVPLNQNRGYLTNCREIFITATRGTGTFNFQYDNGIYKYPLCQDKGRFHPTQKPLTLIRELIIKHSNPGDTVLDCFSGSGTTAVACKLENRNFFGCEIDEEYHKKSLIRLKNQMME